MEGCLSSSLARLLLEPPAFLATATFGAAVFGLLPATFGVAVFGLALARFGPGLAFGAHFEPTPADASAPSQQLAEAEPLVLAV